MASRYAVRWFDGRRECVRTFAFWNPRARDFFEDLCENEYEGGDCRNARVEFYGPNGERCPEPSELLQGAAGVGSISASVRGDSGAAGVNCLESNGKNCHNNDHMSLAH
jgi:hypothetical protein